MPAPLAAARHGGSSSGAGVVRLALPSCTAKASPAPVPTGGSLKGRDKPLRGEVSAWDATTQPAAGIHVLDGIGEVGTASQGDDRIDEEAARVALSPIVVQRDAGPAVLAQDPPEPT